MHVFPQLRKLEHKYRNELAVVGVHSAKFTSEKDTENLRKAVMRYELDHPVVNDSDFQVWSQYGCRAWPTLMFLDPMGKVIGKHEGEITFEDFDPLIQQMVQEFDGMGVLDRSPLGHAVERESGGALSFPGKVLADEASGRLVISDSNHNRIVVATLEGDVLAVVGSGEAGLVDGDFSQARFNHPQGVALEGDTLYVADTENHAVRVVDIGAGQVGTAAGTGRQARMRRQGGEPRTSDLSSPWDLWLHDGVLYIAMAGIHQIWSLDLEAQVIGPYAGDGREAPVDGPLLAASLDQPTGITSDGLKLYFADSEASAIRSADLGPGGRVDTIVGKGLFVFGDVDGAGDEVRLQHPQGIDHHDGVLYVADTYNNKIKRVVPNTRGVATFLGSGEPGRRDGVGVEAEFHEPSGVSVTAGRVFVADTNNHAVRVADLETGMVGTLELKGL